MAPPLFLLLLLLSLPSAFAFVFSCQEVKDKLINSNLMEPTEYVCLVLEQGYTNVEALKSIYAQDDKISVSFYEILTADGSCVPRVTNTGGWRIVADLPVALDCSQQFALIFTSDLPDFILPEPMMLTYSMEGERVLVSPRGGMKIHSLGCRGAGNVSIYTGAGTGVAEYRYALESWRCGEVPEWQISFENVITIILDPGVTYDFCITADFQSETTLNPRQSVSILTSGKSDNLQNAHPLENYANFRIRDPASGNNIAVTVTAKGQLAFDGQYDGYIEFRIWNNEAQTTQRFANNGTVNCSFNATYFEVHYLTSNPEIVWDNQDNFVIDITTSDVLPTKPAPAVPGEVNANGYCGCGMDFVNYDTDGTWQMTDIWLDLIFILDVTEGMASAVSEVGSLVDLIVEMLETNTNAEFYTRVGVITMADVPTVIYDLNMGADDDLDGVTVAKGVYKFDMTASFEAALEMFKRGNATNRSDRLHARQAIYYITNSDPDEIDSGIKEFKSNGGKIIVSDFTETGQDTNPKLKEIASEGFYSDDLKNYLNTFPLLCDVNCFCYKIAAYQGSDPDPKLEANGGCYKVDQDKFPFTNSKKECGKTQNGKIAAPHDKDKEFFLNSLISESFGPKQEFWIGYSSDGSKWTFEDNSTNPWTDFPSGENTHNGVQYAYQVQETGLNSVWHAGNGKAPYPSVCEMAPCSVGWSKCNVGNL